MIVPRVDKPNLITGSNRLNELDITESVCVVDPTAVKHEVLSIFSITFPGYDNSVLDAAFSLFAQVYQGRLPGYRPCDTIYHDIQHSLDIALTTTRLLRGYQTAHRTLDADAMLLGIVTALFHDVGYIRKTDDKEKQNGAEYTTTHISRGVEFMKHFFPLIGLKKLLPPAQSIVHLTGYEKKMDDIETPRSIERIVGDIVATSDLITQMSDRCYLEKCRDRLFPELVLASANSAGVSHIPNYDSAEALLYNTPAFYRLNAKKRLEQDFKEAYKYAAVFFNGRNPYIERLEKNIYYLETLINNKNLSGLLRNAPDNFGLSVFPFERIQQYVDARRAEETKNPGD